MFGTTTMKIPEQPGSYDIVLGHRPVGDDFSYPMSFFFGKCFTHLVVGDTPIGYLRDVRVEGDQLVGVWDYSRQDKHIVWDLKKQGVIDDHLEINLSTICNRRFIPGNEQRAAIRLVTIDVGAKKCEMSL